MCNVCNNSKVLVKIMHETFRYWINYCVMVCHQGSCILDGTWKSAVYGLADQDNLRKLQKMIGYAPVPVAGAKLKV